MSKQINCRQAIETKYMSPTNFKGSRVKAECAAGSVMLHWDYALNVEENHFKAAWELVKKLGWNKTSRVVDLNMGQLKNGNYVCTLKETV